MSKEHFMFRCCLICLVSGNANCVTGLYHAWRFGDRLFIFNCCKKDQNNTVKFSGRTSLGAVKTLSAPSTILWKKYSTVFLSRAPASYWNVLHFFSRQTCHANICTLARMLYNQGCQWNYL